MVGGAPSESDRVRLLLRKGEGKGGKDAKQGRSVQSSAYLERKLEVKTCFVIVFL